MKFNERILIAVNRAPDGWAEKLSLQQFAKLPDERKRYYEPLYAKYRTKKVRDYDLDYGNFVGWKPIQIGIGKPIGYKYVGYYAAKLIDRALNTNVLASRVLRKDGITDYAE